VELYVLKITEAFMQPFFALQNCNKGF
jgi:hypothetical protein